MPTIKLTATAVKSLVSSGATSIRVWDANLPGFGVRVWPSGKKTYMVQFRDKYRRTRFMTLGDSRVVHFEQAKEKAREILCRNVLGEEIDTRRKVALLTIDQLMDKYIAGRIEARETSTLANLRSLHRRYIKPRFGNSPYQELTHKDIRDYHAKLTKEGKPAQADNVVKYLTAMWRWCIPDIIDDLPCPSLKIEFNGSEERQRILSIDEYRALWAAIDGHFRRPRVYKYSVWAIEFIVLTGIRKSEALGIMKSAIDMEAGVIRVKDKGHSRSGKSRLKEVDITEPVKNLLERITDSESDYLFPSYRDKGKPLTSIDVVWAEIRKAASLHSQNKDQTVWIHDLRRSYISFGTDEMNLSVNDVSKAVGHSTVALTDKYYNRQKKENKQKTNQKISEGIAGIRDSSQGVSG
ncbi:putative phage integrase family protein [Magnetospirillum sp. XM-1]|uniref:tyrosine-type recombinase/integrase n=1 Tax=Magnetospirillum sp. XM-1 TaxID=1663591 RepID=UPI00073DE5FB|nr:tyrosine-type recombinase/integrase [Magnetospirillum sp. XM-1]CUW41718.1 putative phage integrase family protein [Magnetospirillum sp. XM-1]